MTRKMLLLALLPFAARADIIAAPGFAYPGSWSGFWIGTYTGIPSPSGSSVEQTVAVAQLFDVSAAYADLTMQIQLSGIDGGEVDFSLATDGGSSPGATLDTQSVLLPPTTGGSLTTYSVSFGNTVIGPGTYWLIASSPTVEPFLNQVQTPIVAVAPFCSPVPDQFLDPICPSTLNDNRIEVQSNGGSWHLDSGVSFAYELDGIDPIAIPEARFGVALLLVAGFLGCAVYRVSRFPRRSRRLDLSRVRANEPLAPSAPDSPGWREAS
jgi:hypothetical protein